MGVVLADLAVVVPLLGALIYLLVRQAAIQSGHLAQIAELRTEFAAIEQQWRARERELVDRLLRQGQVRPLIEVERVVKLPDPEVFDENFAGGGWLRDDEIKEMIEERHPNLASLSVVELRGLHPEVWRRCEARHAEEHAPLRAA